MRRLPVSSDSSQWDLLAGVRCALALIVLVAHLHGLHPNEFDWTAIGLILNQGSAVYGFLLISGYSIAASLSRSREGFYKRRARRIYPVYIVSIALAVAASGMVKAGLRTPFETTFRTVSLAGVLAALLMGQSILTATISTAGQLWTLAVEWWNYILAPLYQRLASVALLVLAALSLCLFHFVGPPRYPQLSSGGLMFGLLTWFWLIGFVYYRLRRTILGCAILVFPLLPMHGSTGVAVWIAVFALAVGEFIPVAKRARPSLGWLGELSYPIYAIHGPVLVFCLYWGLNSPAVVLAVVLAAAAIVLHVMDLPLRRRAAEAPARQSRMATQSAAA